ncbi:glycoside hydrolase family 15 protein [Nocardioides terrisoli]|uniref:glycoside hydrolase family 15 protein n=1 Tax=Nocardioides terrisoli TaxID=3388267 RepID=UPI00287BC92C|nr:glycoside hydrolase family 15 protein [Nocardioides marmorisolisilvae]
MAQPIEDYAVIGDGNTAALVGKDGSIDWLCIPHFDSPACFAALLGDERNGRWLIGPVGHADVSRRYVGDTTVLETTYTTDTGKVRVVDLMPAGDERSDIIRRITGLEGSVTMEHEWRVRTDYGRIRPWVHRAHSGKEELIVATAGPDKLVLRGDRLPRADDGRHRDRFDVEAGQVLTFATVWIPSHRHLEEPLDYDPRIQSTLETEQAWADAIQYDGRHRDAVVRSLVTLRNLTDTVTGGIVAAATTSLPEDFGGERNWDYRYCWLRDASLTLQALLACGRSDEANLWRGWLLRAVAGDPGDLQIMYTLDGSRRLPEYEIDELPGYAGSKPVRVGNGAVNQRQTDVLGEVMCALHDARNHGLPDSRHSWAIQRVLIDGMSRGWEQPDNGLWEIRGPLRHFTHSRVMVWAAFDRAVRAVETGGLDGPVDKWRDLRDRVREEVLEHGFDKERNTFTQHYDTTEVDASLLVLPLVGFIDGDDPRMLGTIAAVEQDLMHEGLLLRYRTQSGVDGLGGAEHPFLACSFWLVSAYALAGRLGDAEELMERLVGLTNDVGLLSEEYDPVGHRMVGNFPQAFSHLALVQAAVTLTAASASDGAVRRR